jgi:hypothetical protein
MNKERESYGTHDRYGHKRYQLPLRTGDIVTNTHDITDFHNVSAPGPIVPAGSVWLVIAPSRSTTLLLNKDRLRDCFVTRGSFRHVITEP